jgi:predicted nucleic acid-binding protein
LRQAAGDIPIVICALTVAELGHGIYHAGTEAKAQQRRRFLDELKQHVPIHPITATTAEIIARVGGEQALNRDNCAIRGSDYWGLRAGTGLCCCHT